MSQSDEQADVVKLSPPALTGNTATDRKNYIEQCFVMDVENTTRERKSIAITDQCKVESNNPSCTISALAGENDIPLDPQEVPSETSIYTWDKCGDFAVFDKNADPGDIVDHVDEQLANLRATASLGSARRRRRY